VRYYVEWAGRTRVVEVLAGRDGTKVLVDGVPHPAEVAVAGGQGLLSLLVDGRSVTYAVRFEDGAAILSFHDREARVRIEDERARAARLATGGPRKAAARAEVRSVMPGVVKEVRVAPGTPVETGQPLLILEAMKMENEIRAPGPGVVRAVHVRPGQAVDKGAPLVAIGPPGPPTPGPAVP
jgi:pyruvate carboxylase subunit B